MSQPENVPLPPHNLEAEEYVLGAMMLAASAIDAVRQIVQPRDFYRESHARIYRAALDLHDTGQLVTLPRVAITIDDTDPTVLKVSFSGSIELERSDPDQAKKFNTLTAGNVADLHVVAYVKSGPTNVHRRDSDGNVDAIVASKSIVITDIRLD